MRHQENFGEAHLSAADGVVVHTERFRCKRRLFLDGCALSGLRGLRPPAAPLRRLRTISYCRVPPSSRGGIDAYQSSEATKQISETMYRTVARPYPLLFCLDHTLGLPTAVHGGSKCASSSQSS
jgi:hypothetical protein